MSEWASTALVSAGKLSQPRTSERKAAVKRASRSTSLRSKHETVCSGRRSAAAAPLVAGQGSLLMALSRDDGFSDLHVPVSLNPYCANKACLSEASPGHREG